MFEKWGREKAAGEGQRWLLTDQVVYCWWSIFCSLGEPSKQSQWVYELMREEGVRALPRSMEVLGRCYDTREFWETVGINPVRSRI